MSNADLILMEYAEVPGSGGSNWTDQETLLLLEALEIFKGKEWDEIAEHVVTKTKEQCMLYFLQMPIFDSFLDGKEFSETPQKITQDLPETGTFDVPEEMDVDDNADGKESTDEKTFKKADANSSETGTKLADQSVSAKEDTMNPGEKTFKKADANSSCCNSLRAISEISPALQLATGHCFILPDPPSNLEDPTSNFSPCTGGECQGGASGTQNVNATDKDRSEREESALALEKERATFTSQKEHMELSNTKESFVEGLQAEVIILSYYVLQRSIIINIYYIYASISNLCFHNMG
nr:SWI/SNF complex subunit SWI3D-like [Setaria viridis]